MKATPGLWIEPQQTTAPAELLTAAGGDALIASALLRRSITTPQDAAAFLNPAEYPPTPPTDLPDLEKGCAILEKAIRARQPIAVWGDFDADGQTSTAVLYGALTDLGARATYHLPVREKESHGVNLPNLKLLLDGGAQVVITCDTGVQAFEAAEYCASRKIPLIITDHHTLPEVLPAASAVINPQRLPVGHPLSYLCGVGVAYQVVLDLYRRFQREQDASRYLDMVAVGTIADLAQLKADNRFLTQRGIALIRKTPRPALQALFDLTETNHAQVNEEHLAFSIAPRLNAAGRLTDANPVVPFLLAGDVNTARSFALELESFNTQRRLLADQVFQAAQAQINRDPSLVKASVLVLHHPGWPGGVIGIVASKLTNFYHLPSILISAPAGQIGRGSARSMEGINITQALASVSSLLSGYGGHPMAAGFSIEPEKIAQFRAAINQVVENDPSRLSAPNELALEGYLALDQISLGLVESLDRLAPFGPGNPAPIFAARDLLLKSSVPIGKTSEHLQVIVEDSSGATRRVIWWQGAGLPQPEGRFDLAFSLRASDFRGERTVTVEWVDARPIADLAPLHTNRPHIQCLDYRQVDDPQGLLLQWVKETSAVVWAEGDYRPSDAAVNRQALVECDSLAVWSIPPGLSEWRTILETAHPKTIALFGIRPFSDTIEDTLKRTAGLVHSALKNRQGIVEYSRVASALCLRNSAVKKSLEWWIAHGDLQPVLWDEDRMQLSAGGEKNPAALRTIETELKVLLQETAAYRTYFLRADPDQLLE